MNENNEKRIKHDATKTTFIIYEIFVRPLQILMTRSEEEEEMDFVRPEKKKVFNCFLHFLFSRSVTAPS